MQFAVVVVEQFNMAERKESALQIGGVPAVIHVSPSAKVHGR